MELFWVLWGMAVLLWGMAVLYVLYWLCRRCFCAAIIGVWRIEMDFLLLTGVAVKKASGKVVPLKQDEFTLEVFGPGVDVPVPAWAPDGTQAAVQITGDEGTIDTIVKAAGYPDAAPLGYSVVILDPAVEIVGNWTRVAAPA